MNVKIVSTTGDNNDFDCQDMTFESGFIVFKRDDNKELFVSSAKIAMMEITDRPKKKEEKKPEKTKKSVST